MATDTRLDPKNLDTVRKLYQDLQHVRAHIRAYNPHTKVCIKFDELYDGRVPEITLRVPDPLGYLRKAEDRLFGQLYKLGVAPGHSEVCPWEEKEARIRKISDAILQYSRRGAAQKQEVESFLGAGFQDCGCSDDIERYPELHKVLDFSSQAFADFKAEKLAPTKGS